MRSWGAKDDFDKQFKRTETIIKGVLLVALLAVTVSWLVIGFTLGKVANNPKGAAKSLGSSVGSVMKSFQKGVQEAK